MHNNYYAFKQLAKILTFKLENSILATAFSQTKNELLLGFFKDLQEFWIKILLLPDTSLLAFPPNFKRAKKNSIDLFKNLHGLNVHNVQVFKQDRLLCFNFSSDFQLVLQAFGKDNNIILFKQGYPEDCFKKSKRLIVLKNLVKSTESSNFESFRKNTFQKIYPSFDKTIQNWLWQQQIETKSAEQQWALIQQLLEYLDKPKYYILKQPDKIKLSFFKSENYLLETSDVLEAYNYFFKSYLCERDFQTFKKQQLRVLNKTLSRTVKYIDSNRAKLKTLDITTEYRITADILMANLHQIKAYSQEVILFDFYHGKSVNIKLNPKLSPQENAARYYRKAKNQKTALAKLQENIQLKIKSLETLKLKITQVEKAKTLKDLQFERSKLLEQTTQRRPYREIIFQAFRIWIGKSAKDNDLLLNRYSHKNDMWLHAKDAKGSHVLIKQQANTYPVTVLEEAASWAATYSTRKHETLAPVSYTLRKYVRKNKGLGLGQTILDREKVIIVKPKSLA